MSQLPLFGLAYWSVSQITHYLQDLFESDEYLQDIWVQGEISNLSKPGSGHVYFTLKDSKSALRCVMWRTTASRLQYIPQDGEAVQVHGRIGIYQASGNYQLYVDLIRPAGEGALFQEFLRLKEVLEAQGLFDPKRKRPIPIFPKKIGVITSPTGAAIRDILNTLSRRYPITCVYLAPTPVQGNEAPDGIISALDRLNRYVQPDVIILARGGGSIEDLWAFNNERVAYAIAESPTPIITGIGHETDFTIADFVSDLRAPTPTAAAEMAVPNINDLKLNLLDLARRSKHLFQTILLQNQGRLERSKHRLHQRSPQGQINSERQRLDELSRRANILLSHRISLTRARLQGLEMKISSLNPEAIMMRGFAIVRFEDGTVVKSTHQVSPGDELQVQVQDGDFLVTVDRINNLGIG